MGAHHLNFLLKIAKLLQPKGMRACPLKHGRDRATRIISTLRCDILQSTWCIVVMCGSHLTIWSHKDSDELAGGVEKDQVEIWSKRKITCLEQQAGERYQQLVVCAGGWLTADL